MAPALGPALTQSSFTSQEKERKEEKIRPRVYDGLLTFYQALLRQPASGSIRSRLDFKPRSLSQSAVTPKRRPAGKDLFLVPVTQSRGAASILSTHTSLTQTGAVSWMLSTRRLPNKSPQDRRSLALTVAAKSYSCVAFYSYKGGLHTKSKFLRSFFFFFKRKNSAFYLISFCTL